MTKLQIEQLTDEAFATHYWALTTNIKRCGGASVAGLRVARRRARRLGLRVYLALYYPRPDREGFSEWGWYRPDELPPLSADVLVTGWALDQCAHKLGDGNVHVGWKRYFTPWH